MKQANESLSGPVEKPSDLTATGGKGTAGPFIDEPGGHPAINFHSPEFNLTDDLNDWSGNYRSFQPLDGIITADMRHQMERKPYSASDSSTGDGAVLKIESKSQPTVKAERSAPLSVISEGRTLIVDTEEKRAMALVNRLRDQGLTCTSVITGKKAIETPFPRLGRSDPLEAEAIAITGAFGRFSATLTVNGDQQSLPKGFDSQAVVFDLVLDLQPVPSYVGECLPLGYYAPGTDVADLDRVMAELPEMRGRFEKPQFTSFLKNRCFHGRSRTHDCRQCLSICSFGAIRSTGREIIFDHYLCQGCGGCALVCPAEAIRLNEPSPEELIGQLRGRLENRSSGGNLPATLVIFDEENAGHEKLPGLDNRDADHRVYFRVGQIAQVGPEIPLAALAYGAGEVLVVCGSQNSPGIKKALEGQMQMAQTILQGLGLPEEKIRLVVRPSEPPGTGEKAFEPFILNEPPIDSSRAPLNELPIDPSQSSATFSPGPDKRMMVRLAVQHLYNQYNQSDAVQPELPLPAGSPFGAITVDGGACTLCLACVTACPSKALSAGGQLPQLKFRESLCHQCGLCQETCPEGAIRLLPRLFCDLEAVETPKILQEAKPFRCIECGLAFTTPAMIKRMEEKLLGHWMYAEERQLRRLRMCGTCRARDALMSEDMRLWNQQ